MFILKNKIDRLAVMLEKIPGAYMSFWKSQALFNRHQDEAHQVTERLTVARENLIQGHFFHSMEFQFFRSGGGIQSR